MGAMADERDEEATTALLKRLLATAVDAVPSTVLGRLSRLAGSMARTGVAFGARRLGAKGAFDPAALERLVQSLGTLKGVAMKAGQIMSYADESLPEEARRILATLQTHSPHVPFERMRGVVLDELGTRGEAIVATMGRRPVAAASIGQVHRGTLPSGHRVAVKIQYPGIETALTSDFRAAAGGARFARLFAPSGNIEDFIAEARERILAECDYVQELAWQQRFRGLFARHRVLRVPKVYPGYSGRRVLTSAWQEGERFDTWLAGRPSQDERNRIGVALYEFYVGAFLRHGVFNADPHPGNYLFRADGKLVIFDYGCVREFSRARVLGFLALRDAVQRDHQLLVREALGALGAKDPGAGERYATVRILLRSFFGPTLTDRVQPVLPASQTGLAQLVADKRAIAELNLPAELLFLFRIRFGLHALLSRIGAEANWYRLERARS